MHGGGKTFQFAHQLGLLKVTKQEVEIHVIQLQVHIGGHKARKIRVVVLLVNMEQLIVHTFYNCKTVPRNHILESIFSAIELIHIDNIIIISQIAFERIVI